MITAVNEKSGHLNIRFWLSCAGKTLLSMVQRHYSFQIIVGSCKNLQYHF